ncbi:MAG: nodulation protein NfeD [Dehalococcoidia bacterium]|nr:nodulation protein NfeD [Dehalococcoidia bacterium]
MRDGAEGGGDPPVSRWTRALRVGAALALLLTAAPGASALAQGESGARGEVFVADIDGAIGAAMAGYAANAVDEAAQRGANAIVFRIDTPGGRVDAMRDIVQAFLEAPLPVIVYVAPGGAQAASAGTFITAAAHVAAIAPGANIGAASPVAESGEDLPDTLRGKVDEDLSALARSIAEKRGRDPAPLEEAVRAARSYSASEAVDAGLVDLQASDLGDLLARVDGRAVELPGGPTTLRTDGANTIELGQGLLYRVQVFLADPTVVFLLIAAGWTLIFIEVFTGFSLIAAGLLGAALIALGFVGLVNLPVHWLAVGLLLVGVLLVAAELNVDGSGVLGAAAVLTFVVGAVLLYLHFGAQTPSWSGRGISLPLFIVAGGMAAGMGGIATYNIVMARRRKPVYVPPVLEGAIGVVRAEINPIGHVFVNGETWRAMAADGLRLEEGAAVEVLSVEGATLIVRAQGGG